MSDAELDPHVLISAKIGSSQKMLVLPSNRARWGWIVILGEAKLRRPPGQFESLKQLRFLAGEFRDCVSAWLDAGLLHAAPNLCSRCRKAFGAVEESVVVVHDWRAHQERRSRTSTWRDNAGVPSGHVNLSDVSPGVSPSVSRDVSPPPVYAGARGRQSQSREEEAIRSNGGGTPNEPEGPVLVYLASIGAAVMPNGNGYHRDLVLLVERQGAPSVEAAMRKLHAGGARTARQLIYGASNRLEPIPASGNSGNSKGYGPSEEEVRRAFGS